MTRFSFGFLIVLSLAACSSDGSSVMTLDDVEPSSSPAAFRDAGPWVAGVTTLMLADRMVEVWYPMRPGAETGRERDAYFIRDALPDTFDSLLPDDVNPPFVTDAYRDAPASRGGPFPLVLFAHGFASYRNQSTFLTTHLASWGFVVASIDYLERGLASVLGDEPDPTFEDTDLSRMVVGLLASENEREGGLLEGRVSTDRIAITGHSAGGGTSIRFGSEPDIVTFIPLSAGISSDSTVELPDKASLWLTGSIDAVVEPERIENAFAAANPPARVVYIENMGHLGPSDICAIGESGGGIVQIALDAGLPISDNLARLGTDGCQDGALPVEDGWPTVRHFVTAQLRWAFGLDEEPVGLSDAAAEGLPETVFTYDESL
jgi:dienelactone hydrolase